MKKFLVLFILSLLLISFGLPLRVAAQSDGEPVVRAVLFYSPTCPHCHTVIDEVLVPMMDEYGEQLQIIGVDVSQSGGSQFFHIAAEHYGIPQEQMGVPMLVVGEVVLKGSVEIPDQFPSIVERGLESGGIDWPDIPGLAEAVAQAEEEPAPEPTSEVTGEIEAPQETETGQAICKPGEEECDETESGTVTPDIVGPAPPPAVEINLTQDGIVRLVFFWSETCPHCHEVIEEHLPPLQEKYGDRLEIAKIETSDPTLYELYLAAIELFDVPPQRQGVPALYIGDTHLVGSNEIPEQLNGLIQQYLDQGGIDYPPIPGLETYLAQSQRPESTEAAPTPIQSIQSTQSTEAQPIHLAYFYQTGCQDCDRVKDDLDYLKSKYPQLVVREFNVREDAALAEWLGERVGVPELHRLTAPTVFVGNDYLLEEELDARSLENLLEQYTPQGAEQVWKDWEEKAGEKAKSSIVERFKSLGVFTVVLAGLIDGLNPCAFATLVFFVSYLTLSGRKGREVLLVGTAFTLGVFVAYVAVGFGFSRVLDLFNETLTALGRWVYGLTAVFCLVLAVISFLDYLKARRGQIGDMALNLPHKLRMRINATIRKTRTSQAFVGAAFFTGIVVSFLELACTGQVYLPTIIFVMSEPELKAQAFLFLLLYNLFFVAPLIVVFVLAYYGTGAKQFSNFLQQRASTVKLGMSLLFLALGGWLTVSLI